MNITTGTVQGKTYTTEVPDELIFIYSKHVYFRAQIEGGAGAQIRLNITSQDGSIYHDEYRYADSEGRVTFDIARVLQMLTDSREKEMSALMYDENDHAPWNMSSFNIMLNWNADMGGYFQSYMLSQYFTTFILVNGAHDNICNWWDKRIRLRYWTNYPFTFDLPNVDYLVFKNASDKSWSFLNGFKIPTDLNYLFMRYTPYKVFSNLAGTPNKVIISTQSNLGTMIKNGEIISTTNSYLLDVDRCPRSDRKTYLRWLGSHGEVFYWLFDNITEDISVKSETYSRAMADNEFRGLVTNRMRGNGLIRHSEQTRTRTIATEYLDNDYYDIVQSIASSPFVDMLVGEAENEKWQRVNVSDASFSRSLKTADRAKRHRIVLTIEISEL